MLSGGAQLRGVHHRCCKKIMLALFCLYPAKKEGCRTPLVISDIRGGGEGEGIRLSSLNLLSAVVGSIVRGNQQVMSQANRRMERHARANTSARWPCCCCAPGRDVLSLLVVSLTRLLTHPSIHPSIIERYDLNVRSGLGDKVKDEDGSKYPASSGHQWSLFQSNGVPYGPRFASRDFLKTHLPQDPWTAMQCNAPKMSGLLVTDDMANDSS